MSHRHTIWLTVAALFLPFTALAGVITSVDLDFGSLPSSQGFSYESLNNSLAETAVFSLGTADGGSPALLQDSLAAGFQGQGSNLYFLDSVLLTNARSVEFDWRARIVQEDNNPASAGGHNHGGFRVGLPGMSVGLGTHALTQGNDPTPEGPHPNDTVALDGTMFHDYLFRLDLISNSFEIFVDGALRSDGPITAFDDRVIFGDATGGANAAVELTRLQVRQTVPEPTTVLLLLSGLTLGSIARRRR